MRWAKWSLDRLRAKLWGLEDRMSVRVQIGLGTSILCFIMVLVVSLGAARVARQQAELTSLNDVMDIASTLADRLDRAIASRLDVLRMLAGMDPLHAAWTGDRPRLRAVLDQVKGSMSGTSWVGFATPDGVVRAGSGSAHEGESAAAEPWFIQGMRGPAFAEAGPPEAGRAGDGASLPLVDVSLPITDESRKVLGVLVLELATDWFEKLRQRTLIAPGRSSDATNDEVSELMVLDAGGRVFLGPNVGESPISHAMLAEMATRNHGAYTATTTDGGMVTGYAPADGYGDYPGLGWMVIARQPVSEAFGNANRVAGTIVLLGLAMGAVGIAVASLLAGRVARPLRTLAETADQIGRDTSDMLPRLRGSREVVGLSSALRSLMVRLGFAERRSLEAELRVQDEAQKFSHDIAALRALADTDILTRLLNRRSFMRLADDALVHFNRYKREFSILMIDIDHFKRVNDGHGHTAGDTAIRYVATSIASLVRPSDKAARFGGEEFVVLLREVSLDAAAVIAERLRTMVGSNPVRFNGIAIPITVSVGVAAVAETDRDVQDVIERADLALYAAKSGGRNAVLTRPLAPVRQRLSA